MRPDIVVVEDPIAIGAKLLAGAVRSGGHIVLAGGSTPRRVYELTASWEDLDWSSCVLWLGDERCVPQDHEHSNSRMVRETLIDRIPEERAPAAWRPIHGELGPEKGAEAYQHELENAFGAGSEPPVFKLILLGLGPDAHTASLFPGDAALAERSRWVVGVETPGMAPFVSRITLTLPVLNAAQEVGFLVSGEDKAEAVARAFGGPPHRDAPASLTRLAFARVTVVLDEAAAAKLEPTP